MITFNRVFVHNVGLSDIIWSRSRAISLTAPGGSERRDAPTLINSNISFLGGTKMIKRTKRMKRREGDNG